MAGDVFKGGEMRSGARNLITDVAGLRVGNAGDAGLKSGATVLLGDQPFVAGVHVMGGAPGARETELLAPDRLVQEVDALVLSGGSAFGLDAASGVADALARDGRGFAVGVVRVPIVPGAILFDLGNGGDKNWRENPYKALGRAAYEAAGAAFEIGSVGAGVGANTMDLKGGLGSASFRLKNGLTVGALVAVNAVGSVLHGAGGHFWAAAHEVDNEFGGLGCGRGHDPLAEVAPFAARAGGHTTLAIIATDARLTQAQATRLAVAAHDGMARAIAPSHTPFDGDLVFAAATGEKVLGLTDMDLMQLGHAGATALARAIARGVFSARAAKGDRLATWQDRFGANAV